MSSRIVLTAACCRTVFLFVCTGKYSLGMSRRTARAPTAGNGFTSAASRLRSFFISKVFPRRMPTWTSRRRERPLPHHARLADPPRLLPQLYPRAPRREVHPCKRMGHRCSSRVCENYSNYAAQLNEKRATQRDADKASLSAKRKNRDGETQMS